MRTAFKDNEIPGRIHALQPFLSTGKLPDGTRRWWAISGPAVELGYLPARLHASARSAVYVVYSYGTPIAWVTENEDGGSRDPYVYHVPDIGYSKTTSTHQMACVEAWATAMKRQGDYRRWPGRGREVVRVPGMSDVYGGRPGRRSRTLHPRSGGIDDRTPTRAVDGYGMAPRASVYDDDLRVRTSAYAGVSGDAMHWDGNDPGRAHP